VNFANPGNPAAGSAVMREKTTSDSGTWSFSFLPSTGFGTLDQTTVVTPAGQIIYRHVGVFTGGNGGVWKIGLLQEKRTGSEQTEVFSWQPATPPISAVENNLRPGDFPAVSDIGIHAPQLAGRTVDRNGTTFSTTYSSFDTYGNPRRVVEAGPNGGNRATSLSYYLNTSLWIVRQIDDETTDGVGSVTREWDTVGRMLSETRDNVPTSYTYHPSGDVNTVTRPRTLTSTYSNYSRGIPQIESHPESVSIQRTVDAAGNVRSETNGEFRTTSYDYDGLNRLIRIQPPTGNTTTISYSGTTKTATRGALTETTLFDGFGRPNSISIGGISTTYRHDALGRMTFRSYPSSSSGTNYTYDLLDRLRRSTHADGSYTERTYSGARTTIRNERGYTTTYTYRSYGDPEKQLLMAVASPVAAASLSVTRNGRGLVESITQDGISRGFGYDSRYYLRTVTNPETGVTRMDRDDAGNMVSRQIGASGTTIFAYDGLNRLKTITYPTSSTPNVTHNYFRTGKLRSVSTSAASRTYGYDANDNLTTETVAVSSVTLSTTYSYNGNDQLSSITYPRSGFVLQLSPDALGRPRTVGPFVTSVTYWPSGQVNQIAYGNGSTATYGQDNRLRPASLVARTGSATILSSSYGYDFVGNLKTVSESVDENAARTFDYDEIDRLKSAEGPWGRGSIDYSGGGNIRSMSLGSAANLSYAYSNNRLASISGSRSLSYSYDAYGNISSAGGATYQFDDASNLRTCTNCSTAGAITYAYDGTNTRLSSTRAGVITYEFWSANGQLLSEFTPSQDNRLVEYFYLAGKRVAQREPSSSSTPPSLIATTTTLSVAPNPSPVNQQVTLTATVTPSSGGAPTGTVDFLENGVVVGSGTLSGSPAVAALSRTYATTGARSVQAVFRGSTTHASSGSQAETLQVGDTSPSGTSLLLTASPATVGLGGAISLTAQFHRASPLVYGTVVSFYEGSPTGTLLDNAMVDGELKARLNHVFKTAGSRTVFAVYYKQDPITKGTVISNGVAVQVNAPSQPPATTVQRAVVELLLDD